MIRKYSLLTAVAAIVACSPDTEVTGSCPSSISSLTVQLIYEDLQVPQSDVGFSLIPAEALAALEPSSGQILSQDSIDLLAFIRQIILDGYQYEGPASAITATNNPLDYMQQIFAARESDVAMGLPGPNGAFQEARRLSIASAAKPETCTYRPLATVAFKEDDDFEIFDIIDFLVASINSIASNDLDATTEDPVFIEEAIAANTEDNPAPAVVGYPFYSLIKRYIPENYSEEGAAPFDQSISAIRPNDGFEVLLITEDTGERTSVIEFQTYDSFCDERTFNDFNLTLLNLNLQGVPTPQNFTSQDPQLGSELAMCEMGITTRVPEKASCSSDTDKVQLRNIDISATLNDLKRIRIEINHETDQVDLYVSTAAGSAVEDGVGFIAEPTFCELQDIAGSDEVSDYLTLPRYFDPGYDDEQVIDEDTGDVINTIEAIPFASYIGTDVPGR